MLLLRLSTMLKLLTVLLLAMPVLAQTPTPALPPQDAVRIHEFYLLSPQIADHVWPDWNSTPAPLLLVTNQTEFLTHHSHPPGDFKEIGGGVYARPRQFPVNLLATFPAFGPPSVIIIGEPEHTEAKTSTPWLFVLMHEHFHQLQDSQPGMFEAVDRLGLARGDTTGMWMLNYPFPYKRPELGQSFSALRDSLLAALAEQEQAAFLKAANKYAAERKKFFAQLSSDDRKYLSFQLWKEGIARYTQVKAAEAAARYQPTEQYRALPDFESFSEYASAARNDSLRELKKADLATDQRVVVYSWGAAEGFLLDRLNPAWKDGYFKNLFTLDPYFNPS
jgi:hypothetical protein